MFWRKQRKAKVSKKALKSAKALKEMGFQIPIETPKKKYPPVLKPFIWTERRLENVLAWLRRLALLEILGIISNVGILFAIVTYAATEEQRRDEVVFAAWQTVTNAKGQPGNGGRVKALEFLNASPGSNWRRRAICLWLCTWQSESLAGVNLSASEAGVGVHLAGVNLTGAYLVEADLSHTILNLADLSHATLGGADLSHASFFQADLSHAVLAGADLTHTNLMEANLTNVYLWNTDLSTAVLARADLSKAHLCNTNLPEDIDLDPNRDCPKLE